jgi:hypothetical protein
MNKTTRSINVPRKIFLRYLGSQDGFVALDTSSGGYPYEVAIDRAHDFKTIEDANKYASLAFGTGFVVCEVETSFSVSEPNASAEHSACEHCDETISSLSQEERARISLRVAAHAYKETMANLFEEIGAQGWDSPKIGKLEEAVIHADDALAAAAVAYSRRG